MSAPGETTTISICFPPKLQDAFSQLSGDYNPIHTDPVFARRTLAGGQVVHGIHQMLAALQSALAMKAAQKSEPEIVRIKALFVKPVLVGETIFLRLAEPQTDRTQVTGIYRNEEILKVTIDWGGHRKNAKAPLAIPTLQHEAVTELSFAEAECKSGEIDLGLNFDLACRIFPLAAPALGPTAFAEVLGLTRLVGMHCPGLHSLFNECAVDFGSLSGNTRLHYRVEKTDARFGKILMSVVGPSTTARLTTFFRPAPQMQPGMEEVARRVQPGSFAKSTALIVGGSRGLGEITARVIAAGGGHPVITYHRGAEDAERIASEIRAAGGSCSVMALDVRSREPLLLQLSAANLMPSSLYYFATPKIFGRRRGFFDYETLQDFMEVYVTAFGQLVDRVTSICPGVLRVFYPSTIAVEENMRELAEYSMAKRAGEELCAFYNQHSEKVKIVINRLPRIHTDQTNTLMPIPAENALDVMIPLVAQVEASQIPVT